jgi:hypothetical protein
MDKKCCDPGVLWLGQPRGTVEKLGGVDTYVARPEVNTGKAAVLVHGERATWHLWLASSVQITFAVVSKMSIVRTRRCLWL